MEECKVPGFRKRSFSGTATRRPLNYNSQELETEWQHCASLNAIHYRFEDYCNRERETLAVVPPYSPPETFRSDDNNEFPNMDEKLSLYKKKLVASFLQDTSEQSSFCDPDVADGTESNNGEGCAVTTIRSDEDTLRSMANDFAQRIFKEVESYNSRLFNCLLEGEPTLYPARSEDSPEVMNYQELGHTPSANSSGYFSAQCASDPSYVSQDDASEKMKLLLQLNNLSSAIFCKLYKVLK